MQLVTKKQLRKKYRDLRRELTNEQVDALSLDIANQIVKLDIWSYDFYHIFLSIQKNKEVDTEMILHILQGKDKNVVVSKSNFKTKEMTHFLLTDSTKMIVNSYGIPEPEDGIPIQTDQIQVIFIPLLAFDTKGNRLGYGGGFYDRFLETAHNEVIKIGLSFFEPEDGVPTVGTDIPLDYCVTPNTVFRF